MHLPCTSWPGRGGIGRPPLLHVRTLARKVTNVIGDEQSRANQPDAHSCDERWHGAGSNAPPIVPATRGSNHCESSDEERPGKGTAEDLSSAPSPGLAVSIVSIIPPGRRLLA